MVDINLLPEDLRKKEEKERAALARKPTVSKFHLTAPEKPKSPDVVKKAPFLKGLLSGRKKLRPPKPFKSPPANVGIPPGEEVKRQKTQVKFERGELTSAKSADAPAQKVIIPKQEKVTKPKPAPKPFKTLAVNLIPDDLDRAALLHLRKKLITLLLVVAASVVFVAAAKLGLDYYKSRIGKKITDTNERTAHLQSQVKAYEDVVQQAQELQELLVKVEALLGGHVYWTKVFAALEQNTLTDVYYTSFTAASNGDLVLQAVGRDYKAMARQLLAFQNADEFIGEVEVSGGNAQINPTTKEVQNVQFTVKIKLNPEIFLISFRKE